MKTNLRNLLLILIAGAFLTEAQAQSRRKIEKIFKQSPVVNGHYTGFALYNQKNDRPIYERDANKPAIPASNTKIFTLYTAMKMLGDSIPGLKYVVKGDSLIFWGTGDPSFLHPDLKSTRVYDFLRSSGKKLFYSHSNATLDFNGAAIYNISLVSVPVGANNAEAYAGADGKVHIRPAFLEKYLSVDTDFKPRNFSVRRDERTNTFYYPAMTVPANFRQNLYLVPGAELTRAMLSDTLKIPVQLVNVPLPANAKVIYSIPADSLYKRMMLPSDNYLAEQILYMCSHSLPGRMSVDSAIAYSSRNYLNDLPDRFQWRDGSGLSRSNLFSPRSIIKVLTKIRDDINDEQRLHNLFPVGGISGTLRTAYKTDNGVPFVWAKTGTLSNVLIQGGYLETRKGKKLLFSFMNNNFLTPPAEVRNEMVRIMTLIREKY